MALFRLATDSGCDLPLELCEKREIAPLLMTYAIGDETFTDTMREDDARAFYEKMRAGALPHTSAVNPEQYLDFWEKLFAESDLPLVHLCMGSGISSTYQNGKLAREMFLESHPDAKLYVVDTLGASASYGMLAVVAADLRDRGKTAEECVSWIEANRTRANAYYTTGDLKWLYLGGRVSKTGMTIARAMNIWPILDLDAQGCLVAREKVRGKKQTIDRMCAIVKSRVEDAAHQTLYVCHADNAAEANDLAARLKKECGFADVSCSFIGSTIGTHTGPGLVTLFFLGKERLPAKK
jgi:DegV family protein with EDD domain